MDFSEDFDYVAFDILVLGVTAVGILDLSAVFNDYAVEGDDDI